MKIFVKLYNEYVHVSKKFTLNYKHIFINFTFKNQFQWLYHRGSCRMLKYTSFTGLGLTSGGGAYEGKQSLTEEDFKKN